MEGRIGYYGEVGYAITPIFSRNTAGRSEAEPS